MNSPNKYELPPGQAVQLTSLLDYVQSSVVSRILMKREHASITLFTFDEGQGLSEHTATSDAVAYFLDGEADVVVAGKKSRLKHGDAILFPANQPHELKATTRFKMLLTMIRS